MTSPNNEVHALIFVRSSAPIAGVAANGKQPKPPRTPFEALSKEAQDRLRELGPQLLNLNIFRNQWGYAINTQLAGEAERRPHRVDLVETFNYLIGLKVKAYGPIERYAATFDRAKHADDLGRLIVVGRLRRDKDGPFVFRRVEGELNDGNATRVLVVWRTLTDEAEQDAAVLDAWMDRHRETTRERTEHREYQIIYINGPVTLAQPTAELRTVWPIEQTFKDRMFADSDGGAVCARR